MGKTTTSEPKPKPSSESIRVASTPKRGYEAFGPRLGRKRVDGLGRGWC